MSGAIPSKSERIGWIDTAKGIGMILVLIGHILQVNNTGMSIRIWIYSMHMPLFFLISGYLIKDSAVHKGLLITIRKEAKALLLPYAVFTLFDTLLDCAFGLSIPDMTVSEKVQLLRNAVFLAGWNATWFCASLFAAKVFCIISEKLFGSGITAGICLIVTLLSAYVWQKGMTLAFLGRTGCAVFPVYAGRILRRKNDLLQRVPWWGVLLGAILWIGLAWYNGYTSIFSFQFGRSIVLWLINGLLGSIVLIRLCSILPESRVIGYFGVNSLIYMSIHQIVLFTLVRICGCMGMTANVQFAVTSMGTLVGTTVLVRPISFAYRWVSKLIP